MEYTVKKVLLAFCFALAAVGTAAQTKKITGTVRDDTGEPLPGVGVFIEGTATGTLTQSDGTYSLSATDKDILTFSSISFTTVRESIAGRSVIDVTMMPDQTVLEEVDVFVNSLLPVIAIRRAIAVFPVHTGDFSVPVGPHAVPIMIILKDQLGHIIIVNIGNRKFYI